MYHQKQLHCFLTQPECSPCYELNGVAVAVLQVKRHSTQAMSLEQSLTYNLTFVPARSRNVELAAKSMSYQPAWGPGRYGDGDEDDREKNKRAGSERGWGCLMPVEREVVCDCVCTCMCRDV